MRQQEIADGMRVLGYGPWERQTVSSVEHGNRRVTAEELFGLAKVLNTTVRTLTELSPANGVVLFPNDQEVISVNLLG